MHFVLYIPGTTDNTASDALCDVGCAHLAEDVQTPQKIAQGPDGGPGRIFAWMNRLGRVHRYQPTKWIPACATEGGLSARYWLGVNESDLPTPQDLQRKYLYEGESIELGDGNHWVIPREYELPHQVRLMDDGSLRFIPQRKFHDMHVASEQWRQAFTVAQVGHHFVEGLLAQYVDHALGINYRTVPELTFNALELYTSHNSGTVHPALKAALSASTPAPSGVSYG